MNSPPPQSRAIAAKFFDCSATSVACAALAGCEMCLRAHEQSLLAEGYTEDRVHQAIRIAAVVNGFVVAAGNTGGS